MTDKQFDEMLGDAPQAFADLLSELRDSIREASVAVLEESQLNDDGGKPKVRVSFGLVIDLAASPVTWQLKAAVSVKHAVESDVVQVDATPMLPGMEKRKGVPHA